jgi:sterol 3beta-glucosyltransferase
VYIGFGSLRFPAPERTLDLLMQVLEHLDLYAVIARGWSGFPPVPHPRIHWVEAVPHEWLFPRVDAVVHHGGAGTTAMGLRFGKPTLILPFLADQFFWGKRVEAVGAGRMLSGHAARDPRQLARALQQILRDPEIRENAAHIGQNIQQEQGIDCAVREILQWIGG